MIIIHKVSEFLFDLFPKAKEFGNSIEMLKEEIQTYYTFGIYKPKVSIVDGFVKIVIDVPTIINQKPEFDKAITLCEKRKFTEAKKILEKLIKDNHTVSEYHRILGQINSEEGNQEEAINNLIDALKWDSKNGYALIMMGNIFVRHKDDIDTACKYFNEALVQNPNDSIAINNLGTNLIQLGKWNEGLKYLQAAYKLNPNYPNTNYGIALAYEKSGNTLNAFDYSIATLKKCGIHDQNLFNHTLSLINQTAEKWTKTETGKNIFKNYKETLEEIGKKEIKIEVDESLSTAAKIEFAENYNRNFHLIKYKGNYLAVEHLMMHELVHLEFVIKARKQNSNMLFITNGEMKAEFIKTHFKSLEKLSAVGGG